MLRYSSFITLNTRGNTRGENRPRARVIVDFLYTRNHVYTSGVALHEYTQYNTRVYTRDIASHYLRTYVAIYVRTFILHLSLSD